MYEGTVDRDGERQPFASYSLAFEKNIPLLGKLWYFIKGRRCMMPMSCPPCCRRTAA